MKIVIAGGGTGGHLYPGITIARELLREAGNDVLFIGTEQGIEARVLPEAGLPVRFITAGKLKGMGILSVIKTIITIPRGIWQSVRLLRTFRPDAVIGVGGYASVPVALAAGALRIPLLIVEPNSYAGLANRLLGKLASLIVLCFPGTNRQGFFPQKKMIQTGPLVRHDIRKGNREQALRDFGLAPDRFTVLVFGGSGGAHAINMAMKDAAEYLGMDNTIQILHQTGNKDREAVLFAYKKRGITAVVLPYIDDMAGAYAAADLVISRSGATTVAELAVCGKPAVLIPYPFAADNHQEYNAKTLAARGTADVIIQRDLTPQALAQAIQGYAERGGITTPAMETDAAEVVVRSCKRYVQKN